MLSPVDFRRNRNILDDYGPSPEIWHDCPVLEFIENPGKGIHVFEDWRDVPVLVTPTITTAANYGNGWQAFGSAGGTIVKARIEGGGGLVFTETDDDQGLVLQYIQSPFKIDRGKGDFFWECRFKIGTITNNDSGIFAGMIEPVTPSAIVPIAADGTLADQNLVGFHRLEADGDQLDTVYKANGVTQVTVESDVLDTTNTDAGALVADTYINVGMKFRNKDNTLRFYVNNCELPTVKEIPDGDGTDFPNDVLLSPTLALLCGSNNDSVLTAAWMRFAQRFV
jgi:hypothetical protein